MRFQIEFDSEKLNLEAKIVNGKMRIVFSDGRSLLVEEGKIPGEYLVIDDNRHYRVFIKSCEGNQAELKTGHLFFQMNYKTERELLQEKFGSAGNKGKMDGLIKAPIPGLLLKILVNPGDDVKMGQAVAILEAMKMENEIHAVRSGTVVEILAEEGKQVDKNQPLIRIK